MDYAKHAAKAQAKIDKVGRSVVMQRLSAEAVDSGKPWKGAGAPTVAESKEVKALFVPAAAGGLGRNLVSEELLKRVSQVALIAPTDVDLEAFNVISDGGVQWKVDWIETLKPADIVVLYIFGVKR